MKMNGRNFYEILKAQPNSSYEELKANYKQLILQCHPDKLPVPGAAAPLAIESEGAIDPNSSGEFVAVNEAWNTLRDPAKRKLYDAELLQMKFQQHNNVYERLTLSDMTKERQQQRSDDGDVAEDETIYTYNCRCGGQYIIDESTYNELFKYGPASGVDDDDEEVLVDCSECSLSILLTRLKPQT